MGLAAGADYLIMIECYEIAKKLKRKMNWFCPAVKPSSAVIRSPDHTIYSHSLILASIRA